MSSNSRSNSKKEVSSIEKPFPQQEAIVQGSQNILNHSFMSGKDFNEGIFEEEQQLNNSF